MAQNYLFIAISFYRNIVYKNVSRDVGLRFQIFYFFRIVSLCYTSCTIGDFKIASDVYYNKISLPVYLYLQHNLTLHYIVYLQNVTSFK